MTVSWRRKADKLSISPRSSRIGLPRQAVLTVVLHDAALTAGVANGQLSGAFGAIRPLHDLLPELVMASLLAHSGQDLGDILGFHFSAWAGIGRSQPGGGEPQRVRFQLEQPRRRRRSIAKLKA